MARISADSLDAKIQKAEEKVMRLGDQYNAACEELKGLRAKKQAIENDALIKAFLKSDRTFDEAMAFFVEGTQQEESGTATKGRRGRRKKTDQ